VSEENKPLKAHYINIQKGLKGMKQPYFEKYSIFQSGGKQYQAIEGQTIALEKLAVAAGDKVEFAEVLLRKESADKITIGQPFVDVAVRAVVIKHGKEPKKIIFKFKRRKKYRVTQGHRQPFTVVRIEAI
jgi:large subunit ribosomal protein L21